MKSCFGSTSALRAHVSPLSLLVLLLASAAAHAVPPTVVDDSPAPIDEGGSIVNFNVLANDTNPELGNMNAVLVDPPDFASSFNLNQNGNFDYTHNGTENFSDSFTYQADNGELSAVATVTITINAVNDPPVAVDDAPPAVDEGGTINGTFNVLDNDTDAENDLLTAVLISSPANATTFALNANGTFTYEHDGTDTLIDSFTYQADDGTRSNTATVTITINAVNDPPVAVDDAPPAVDEGGTINGTFNVLDNDTDAENDLLTAVLISSPANATTFALNANGTFTYEHDGTDTLIDSFTYQADDGTRSNTATVTITINAVNDPPVAVDDAPPAVDEGGTISGSFNVLDNDTDAENDPLTAVLISSPANATTFALNANGTFTYEHDGTDTLIDSFTYQADDGTRSNTATVTITINAVNDPPVAVDDAPPAVDEGGTINGTFNVLDNDTDAENDLLTAVLISSPANATTFALNANGTFTYEHDGTDTLIDSFTYQADDGTRSNTATVTITINAVNDPPVAVDDAPPAVDEGGTISGSFNVLDNDTDAENDPLTAVLISSPANATTFALNANGTFTYEHDGTDTLIDSFTYQADDGTRSNTATVTITINAVNDPPEAFDDGPFLIDEGGTIDGTINVLDNDTDIENDVLSAVLVTAPTNALAFALNADGTFTYTHDGSETITDSFTYQADDGAPSNTATVSFTINPVNDLPAFVGVVPPGLTTLEDTTLTIVLADLVVSDPDNVIPDELTLTLSPPGLADNYTLAGATAITPALNFNGQLNVVATVSDLEGVSAPFLIPVGVDPVNDLPVVVTTIGPQQAVEDSPFVLDITPNFSDDDVTDTLTYTATWLPSRPPNINLNAISGIFSGTPQLVDADPPGPIYTVSVTAEDPAGEIVSDTFDLTINALGRANLNMAIDVSPATASPSEELRWTFTTNNPIGPVAGENVQITGSFIGAGITVTAVGAVNCTLDVQPTANRTDFTCDVGNVPVGGSPSIAFSTSTSVATEIVAFGTAAGVQRVPIDPNEDDNSDLMAAGVADSFSMLPVQDLGTSSIRSVAAGDVNGDGAPDIVVGTMSGQSVQVFFSAAPREACNCLRDFLAAPIAIPDTGSNEGVALGDFDGNGTLDLVVANGGDQDDVVYSNDGNGNFSPRHTLGASNANDVAVGDFDSDGILDIVVAASSPNLVYYGNGNGTFSNATQLGDADSISVAVGRLDGNNRVDIAFANSGADSTVYTKNNGGTGFTLRDQLAIGDAASVAAGDLNGDGIDDLVFGRIATNVGDIPSNPVLINNGNGTFGGPLALLGLSPTLEALIGDVNEDGAPDLVFINSSGVHQVWLDTGGNYTLHSEQIMDLDSGSGVLTNLGDADDGDPGGVDLAMGGRGNAGVGVWLNDSQGNLGLGDAVIPVLTLNGEASVSVPAKSNYIDAGATALDNIDGNISASIIVSNSVNTSIVGSYVVTYNVQDRAGNPAAQISRSVSVTPAAGGGGGGGGAVSYWLLALLLAVNIAGVIRMRQRAVPIKGRKDQGTKT